MKRIIKYLLILCTLLLSLVCITACGDDTPDVNTYLEPQADFFKVTWNSIEGATEYIVKIDGKKFTTKETCYPLYDYILPGETKMISVMAVVDGVSSAERKWELVEYTAESVTEGLVYTLLDDETYSVYCPSNAIPANGELVLPDTYEGEPVTVFRSEKNNFVIPVMDPKSTSDYNGPAYTGISKVRLSANLSEIRDGALYQASISELYIPVSVEKIGTCAFEGCKNLREVTLSSSLREIGHFAFSDCTSLTSIKIPDSVTTLGVGTFARSGLTEIELPIGITRIQAYTFYGCESLPEIEYSENVAEIGTEAFHNTLWYNSQPNGILCHKGFLYGYKGDMPENTTLNIPADVKRLRQAGFKDETNLVAITLPNGILSIPDEFFSGCTNLRQVTLPESLTSIGNGAFYNCSIESIKLPNSLKHLGNNALLSIVDTGPFEKCKKLTSVTIPSSTTTINDRCFYDCTNLENVTINEGVKSIGKNTFACCTALKELTLPESTTNFHLTSVAYTGVTSLVWPKNLSINYFDYLESGDGISVTSLVIQKGTKRLDYYLFFRCDGLKTFYFAGTEQAWKEVEIDRNPYQRFGGHPTANAAAKKVLDAWESRLTVYFYSETEPTEEGNYWHYVDGVPVKW